MTNIVHIGEIINDNRLLTPETILQRTAEELGSGEEVANKCVVLLLNSDGDIYDSSYRAANISKSEMLALLAMWQTLIARELAT